MGEELRPKLLDLMVAKEKDWMVRDSGGGVGGGIGVQEAKKLELKLGPPGAEDWGGSLERKVEDPSALYLGYLPKASKPTKRGFLDTVKSKNEGCPSSAPLNVAGPSGDTSQARATAPVVGWPPIRSFRKNLASSSASKPPLVVSHNQGSETAAKPEACKRGLFVKINMDGIPIGRKVDLKAYDSYDKLSSAVEELFQRLLAAQQDPAIAGAQVPAEQKQAFSGLLDGTGEYTLVYEDNEGDRMLVGDVPWEMFVATAKRLRVLKSSELSTLNSRSSQQEKNSN